MRERIQSLLGRVGGGFSSSPSESSYPEPAAKAEAAAGAAAALEFAGGAAVTGFIVLLAPSPVANDFTEAGPDNKAINALVMSKMPPTTLLTVKQRYPELFNRAYTEVQAKKKVIKP